MNDTPMSDYSDSEETKSNEETTNTNKQYTDGNPENSEEKNDDGKSTPIIANTKLEIIEVYEQLDYTLNWCDMEVSEGAMGTYTSRVHDSVNNYELYKKSKDREDLFGVGFVKLMRNVASYNHLIVEEKSSENPEFSYDHEALVNHSQVILDLELGLPGRAAGGNCIITTLGGAALLYTATLPAIILCSKPSTNNTDKVDIYFEYLNPLNSNLWTIKSVPSLWDLVLDGTISIVTNGQSGKSISFDKYNIRNINGYGEINHVCYDPYDDYINNEDVDFYYGNGNTCYSGPWTQEAIKKYEFEPSKYPSINRNVKRGSIEDITGRSLIHLMSEPCQSDDTSNNFGDVDFQSKGDENDTVMDQID